MENHKKINVSGSLGQAQTSQSMKNYEKLMKNYEKLMKNYEKLMKNYEKL